MLRFSDYSYAEIAASLAFSSQSHFIRVFRVQTGYTPKEFRNRFFRKSEKSGGSIPLDKEKADAV